MPPCPPRSAPASLTPASRFSIDSNRSPMGAATASTAPERDRLADRQEVLLVQGHECHEHRRGGSEYEPLPRLPRRRVRRHLVSSEQAPADIRERVSRPHGEHHRERREPPVIGQIPQQQHEGQAAADPHRAHHRRRDRGGRRLTRRREPLEQEREGKGRQHSADHPEDAAPSRRPRARARRRHSRPARAARGAWRGPSTRGGPAARPRRRARTATNRRGTRRRARQGLPPRRPGAST